MVADDPESFADLDGHCCEEVMEIGEELWSAPHPVAKVIGGLIIAVAVVGTAASSPEVREKVTEVLSQNPGDAPFVIDEHGNSQPNPILRDELEQEAIANGTASKQNTPQNAQQSTPAQPQQNQQPPKGDGNKQSGANGLPKDAVKLKGNQGYRDKNGNIWKKDKLHKDHWDVTDRKGNKVKEVDFNGKQIWPDGPKNKNKQPS